MEMVHIHLSVCPYKNNLNNSFFIIELATVTVTDLQLRSSSNWVTMTVNFKVAHIGIISALITEM